MTVKSEETLGNSKKYNRRRPSCQSSKWLSAWCGPVKAAWEVGAGPGLWTLDTWLGGKGRIRYLSWGVTHPV